MSNDKVWFGYLEAGDKSTVVVRDSRLHTGNPQTVYLYNALRDKIIEYRCDILEPKLRELTEEEHAAQAKGVNKAFNDARANFTPRVAKAFSVPERATAGGRKSKERELEAEYSDGDGGDSEVELDEE